MVFSDSVFLFVFFPLVIGIYYLLHIICKRIEIKNIVLLLCSLFFYAWGNVKYIGLFLFSILVNYLAGRVMEKAQDQYRKWVMFTTLVADLAILFYYKYLGFAIYTLNEIFSLKWEVREILLPIGISFFTFQAISYVLDVYYKKVKTQRSLVALGLYISFFPQLIAGPIVRYQSIEEQIYGRSESMELFSTGMRRFVIGLSKKVLLANNLAICADYVFEATYSVTAVLTFWLGALAYTLQIYFDFSGYSDMAIGLGKMFGFEFEENFNYPYISKNVTDFWRRWHISLGSWFRDYVYIPLGGNRCTISRNIANLLVVWLLTGIWHGANWTFLVWGLSYFVVLVVEKYIIHPLEFKSNGTKILYRIFTLLFVVSMWVVFRCDSVIEAMCFFKSMYGGMALKFADDVTRMLLAEFGIWMLIAVIASIPIIPKVKSLVGHTKGYQLISAVSLGTILWVSIIYILNGSYNPFIYFNF